MDRVGAVLLCRRDDAIAAQVAVARLRRSEHDDAIADAGMECADVGFAADGNRLDATLAGRARDTHGDLAAVRDQQATDGSYGMRHGHIRNTPNVESSTGAFKAADRAKASTRRVSLGDR
jgi:hypothetical protein